MDTLTALVTIVQLLAVFTQERGSSKLTQKIDFMRWLDNHNHQQLKDIIENNRQLNEQIQALLLQNDDLILTRVSEINQISSEILSKIDLFAGITGD